MISIRGAKRTFLIGTFQKSNFCCRQKFLRWTFLEVKYRQNACFLGGNRCKSRQGLGHRNCHADHRGWFYGLEIDCLGTFGCLGVEKHPPITSCHHLGRTSEKKTKCVENVNIFKMLISEISTVEISKVLPAEISTQFLKIFRDLFPKFFSAHLDQYFDFSCKNKKSAQNRKVSDRNLRSDS